MAKTIDELHPRRRIEIAAERGIVLFGFSNGEKVLVGMKAGATVKKTPIDGIRISASACEHASPYRNDAMVESDNRSSCRGNPVPGGARDGTPRERIV